MSNTLMVSTSEMPDTAASPTEDTITVSAIPMVTAKICSITSGMISLRKSFPENNILCILSLYPSRSVLSSAFPFL